MLVPVINTSTRKGSFAMHRREWSRIERAARVIGASVAGTYHSHLLSEARPGDGDLQGACDGDLMLILDTVGKTARLWRVRRRHAYSVNFELI